MAAAVVVEVVVVEVEAVEVVEVEAVEAAVVVAVGVVVRRRGILVPQRGSRGRRLTA